MHLESTALFAVPVLFVFEAELGAENAIEKDAEEKGETKVHEVEDFVDSVLVLQRGYVAHGETGHSSFNLETNASKLLHNNHTFFCPCWSVILKCNKNGHISASTSVLSYRN